MQPAHVKALLGDREGSARSDLNALELIKPELIKWGKV